MKNIYNEKDRSKWTKDGRHWFFKKTYTDTDGTKKQYCSAMFSTQAECEKALSLFLLKTNQGVDIKFTDVADLFLEDYKSKKKLSSYESCLYCYNKWIRPYFEKYLINKLTIAECKNWKEWIRSHGMSLNYENKLHNIVKCIFDFAMINYGVTSNPFTVLGRFERRQDEVVKDEDKIRYITLDNFNRFIDVIDNSMWRTFFLFLFYTGCRKGEVLALTWEDIDFSTGVVSIHKTLYGKHDVPIITNTKTGVNRRVKMSKVLFEAMRLYHAEVSAYTNFSSSWFVFGNDIPLKPTTIDRIKNNYFALAELEPITIHEFRHSHVSLLINEYIKKGGTDTSKFFLMVSDRLGHSTEVMKRTYLHLFPTTQDDIVDLLDSL